jgi:hypothetical protein
MTSATASLKAVVPSVISDEDTSSVECVYRTKTSFAAVQVDQTGRGLIVFLPPSAILHVIGRSSLLAQGCKVKFEQRIYNVFEIDLVTRSMLILESNHAKETHMAVGG